jgi:DNA-binding CsgD family transcriptional regulator
MTLIISGEAGIGKSRLVLEARQQAANDASLVLQGNCFDRDSTMPYSAVTDMLRGSLLELPSEQLEPALQRFGSELVKLVPELAFRYPAISPSPGLDGEQERRRLFHALSQLLVHLSEERRLLLLIEDLHWADETTLEFLLYCCRHVSASGTPARVRLVLTYRSEDAQPSLLHALAELDRLRLAEEMHLDQFTRAETEVMVRAILELHLPLGRDFLDELFRLTDGNPFFIEEVLKSLDTTGGLEILGGDDRFSFNEVAVPRTVRDAVMRRSSQVSPEAHRLLDMAAVMGQRFDLTLLQAVLSTDADKLVSQAKELVAAQLVVEESAGRFRFRHALSREAVYSSLLLTERTAYHRVLAEAIELLQGEQPSDQDGRLVDLAHHFYMAGVWTKAQFYCEQAGRRAHARFAPAACVEHLSHAIEAARRTNVVHASALLRLRAAAFEMLGEFNKALADLDMALASARRMVDQEEEWETLISFGMLWLSKDYDRAGAFFQEALSLAQRVGDRRREAHSLNRVGNCQMNIGDPAGALTRHNQALSIFEESHDVEGVASTLDLLGMTSYHSVKLADEMSYHREAIELFRQLGNRQGAVSSQSLLAASASSYDWPAPPSDEWELAAAIAAGNEALADAKIMGWRAGESFSCYALGMTLGCGGDYRRALPLAREGLRIAIEIEHEQWRVASLRGLGELHLDLLDPAGARTLLEEGLDLAKRTKSDFWEVALTSSLARALVALGDPRDALELLSPFDEDTPLVLKTWLSACAYVETALALKDFPTVLRLSERLERTAWPDGRPSRLSLCRAEALLGLKRISEAAETVGHVLQSGPLLPKPLQWRARLLLGRVESAHGRRGEAARAYRAARKTVLDLATAVEDLELRGTFLRGAETLLPRLRPETEARALVRERFGGLTERECHVASFVASGRSNAEIARALVISERTVETHVTNILTKLGSTSRSQIAAWAAQRGLAIPSR